MAKKGEAILASDFNDYYARLNKIRVKFGLAEVEYPLVIEKVDFATSEQMQKFKEELSTIQTSSKYLKNTLKWDPKNQIDQGAPIQSVTWRELDKKIENIEVVCAHGSICTVNGTGGYSNYGDAGGGGCADNTTCGQNTNAVNDNFSTAGNDNNSQWGSG